ncbi:MAG: enoyl-CoA hydratase/isomerase family protein, partial [Deltaproteobacteria bacterium]|nr:enoyl-CoA hydratase/isomerase family protein [Deltaproteobacteria bacterium]
PPNIMRGLEIWKPLIAAVNGPARGGGVEIALACDIRILSETATLQLPEAGRGLIPGWGGTQRLPRMVSPAKAAEVIFLGLPMNAEEAYRLGLVNKVVPKAQLLHTAEEWAVKICEKGPLAIRRAKEAMIRGRSMTLEDGLRLELAFFEEMLRSEEYQEGLRSLAEGRKPKYRAQ